jgi:signal transduction histidine kinase
MPDKSELHDPSAAEVSRFIARYALAVMAVTVAILIRLVLDYPFSVRNPTESETAFLKSPFVETPFLLLFLAVLVTAAFAGYGPGVVATLLGAFLTHYLFDTPRFSILFERLDVYTRTALFVLEGVFISAFASRLESERQRAKESEAETRRLEQRILDISEDERRRFGQDLHDGLGQHLTGVAFLSKALQQRLAAQNRPETEDATKISKLVTESIGQTRSLAKGLAPVGLEDGGIHGALKQLAAAAADVYGIQTSATTDESLQLDDLALATHVYRIAQEALNNAVRHGKAKNVEIKLLAEDANFRLTIDDDGSGLGTAMPLGGMGLQIMRFRARILGGSLEVRPRDRGGTSVDCVAPRDFGRQK